LVTSDVRKFSKTYYWRTDRGKFRSDRKTGKKT